MARRHKVLEEWGGNQGRLPGGVAPERKREQCVQRPGGVSQGCPLRGAQVRMVVGAGPDAQARCREGTGDWGAPLRFSRAVG